MNAILPPSGSATYTVSKELELKQVTITFSDANGEVKETPTLHPKVGFKLTYAGRRECACDGWGRAEYHVVDRKLTRNAAGQKTYFLYN